MKRKNIRCCLVVPVLLAIFLSYSQAVFVDELTSNEKFYIQQKILENVRESYVDTTIRFSILLDGAIKGMIDNLDPHSSYMPFDKASEFNEKILGGFEGIGITFSIIDKKITIIQVIEGGPSEKVGLKSRDKIVKINGESAIGIAQDSVRDLLRGRKGSRVTVHVERPGEEELLQFMIIRDKIKLNSVSHAYMLDKKTGYIAISKFTTKTRYDVDSALKKLKDQGMKRLLLDLRNNSGGSLEAAMNVVDFFIEKGLSIVETKGKRKADNHKWDATDYAKKYSDIPMIILINHGSASASEIVAGALQDHDRALIVGQTSFGKGLVMNSFTLKSEGGKNLGSLILSVAHYYTPSGRLIQRPYDSGKEDYIMEGYDDIDPNAPDSSKAGKPVFYTDLGREVYGGGGITPDRKLEPLPRLNKLETALRRSNLFFEFADGYLLRYNDIPEDFEEFLYNYRIPEEELLRFKQFITDNGISINNATIFREELKKLFRKFDLPEGSLTTVEQSLTEDNIDLKETLFEKSIHFIEREIKQEIARMIWGTEERFKVWHTDDTELIGALSYFDEAEALLKKRIAMGKPYTEPSHVE